MENLSLSPAVKVCPLAVLFASRQDDSECAFTEGSILKHNHIPVDQQFPEFFIAYIHVVSLNSNRFYSKKQEQSALAV